MKKHFFFHPVILLTFVSAFILFSCSKEKEFSNPVNDETAMENDPAARVANSGAITGMILPERADVKISVYNRYFTTNTFYYTKDGYFRVDHIPPGVYAVVVTNNRTSENTEIPDIKVQPGKVTDMGSITIR